jgi:long-chain acyl-CoA synthetase
VQGIVREVNDKFARVENIRKFRMIPKALDHEDGELTATQKVKRSSLMQLFETLVDDMYSGADALAGGDLSTVIVVQDETVAA